MSTFGIFTETIGSVRNHPNADRLDIAELDGIGYQFVVGRDQYRVGDRVLYFPLDAVLPTKLTDALGLTGKLGGKTRDRVKTIKLRGEISQGLVGSVDLLRTAVPLAEDGGPEVEDGPGFDGWEERCASERYDYAEVLGVTKHQPPEPGLPGTPGGSNAYPLPAGVRHYDLENAERYKAVVESLMDAPVVVTEKLEGSHVAVTRAADGRVSICSRNCTVVADLSVPVENGGFGAHYRAGVVESGVLTVLASLAEMNPDRQVTIRGELLGPGVQGNIYGLDHHTVLLFEGEVDGEPVDAAVMNAIAGTWFAPVLHFGILRDWLAGRTMREASDGFSALAPKVLREGVVVRPMCEMPAVRGLGRVIIKQRSPAYLAGEKD